MSYYLSFESLFWVLVILLKALWYELLLIAWNLLRQWSICGFVIGLCILNFLFLLRIWAFEALSEIVSERGFSKRLIFDRIVASVEWFLKWISLGFRTEPSLESSKESMHHSFILAFHRISSFHRPRLYCDISFSYPAIALAHLAESVLSYLIWYLKNKACYNRTSK